MKTQKPREIAVNVLIQREAGRHFTENILDRSLQDAGLSAADRALCRELVSGCVRWQLTLDELIDRRTDGRRQPAAVRALLRLGLYQLIFLTKIPPHAAVHETVAMASTHGCSRQKGFINAVLRHYGRELEAIRGQVEEWKESDLALGFSHPRWLIERWTSDFGLENTRALLEWNNQPAPTFARVNTLKTTAAELTRRWSEEESVEFEAVERDWLPGELFFQLKSNPPIAQLKSFQGGCFYVQDPSTALACLLLDPRPGERILDYCAAPGGKTTLIAQMANNQADIVAQDHHMKRLRRIQENCERLGVTSVSKFITSVDREKELGEVKFDKILLDVPCSNSGVMRRRIDLRWRLTEAELQRLVETQRELLGEAKAWLKPGGRIVYSTCSIDPLENAGISGDSGSARQLTPFGDGCDGAFACVIEPH
ncbi:MAG: 16S rRNA (cytosine(967)-C(5))-methyltransferase RsmB [Verrucomicrobiae bacterium]|nr:16S rRNA (cytosine(967)-C(5))-methyltransferase RsmB [Verrucomicrobiae bacterium]